VKSKLLAASLVVLSTLASAADPDPCEAFTWDVSRERALMAAEPLRIVPASKSGESPPLLEVGKAYALALVPQAEAQFAVAPGRPTKDVASSHAGLVRFRVETAGLYRIALSSSHWVDVIDGDAVVPSQDQSRRGCQKPHKVVALQLSAGRDLVLQLSGAAPETVVVAIIASPATR